MGYRFPCVLLQVPITSRQRSICYSYEAFW